MSVEGKKSKLRALKMRGNFYLRFEITRKAYVFVSNMKPNPCLHLK